MQQYYWQKMKNNLLFIAASVRINNRNVYYGKDLLKDLKSGSNFKSFSRELYKQLACDYPKFYKMDNLCKLAFLGVELLVNNSGQDFSAENTALFFANSGSTIDTDIRFAETLDKIPSPAIFVYTLPNITAGEISIRHGWKGENIFLISDRLDPDEMSKNLFTLFADTQTEKCVAGWIDYLSDSKYDCSLWLITRERDGDYRKLDALQLASDHQMI